MAITAPSRAARLAAALAALGLLASCAPGGRLPVRDEGDILRGPLTTWTGGLHCALGFGDAGGTLTLRGELGNVEAIFAYEVSEPLTQIPPGRLRMTGRVGSDGSVELRGTRWIDGAAGQGLFDLTGTLDVRRGTFNGTVPQCGEGSPVFLERVAGPPS